MSDYQDSSEEEKHLAVEIAKMFEHAEWENALPEQEKSQRRLEKLLVGFYRTLFTAFEHDMPYVFLGHMERMIYHCKVLYGEDCFEQAVIQRKRFLFGDEEDN